ncbi:MAG TPA: GDP-mannose 4,6-dehydratase [bacterium]|nr:GDP-mannose 4,6-dehydratase [bacterium]
MKILVTGGAGFIGSHLVDRLLADGMQVVCIDNFDSFYDPRLKERNIAGPLKHRRFTLYRDDIRDLPAMEKIFKKHRPDALVHLAARAGVRPSIKDPLLYEDVNIKGTMNLLECAKKYGVKKTVFGSSSSVYGAREKIPFKEDELAQKPISPYAATKMAGELLCYTYHHLYKMPITCLRFFTVYGPRQRPEMGIHKFTREIVNGETVEFFGDGHSARDYTFVLDIVEGICAAIGKDLGYEIINLGDCNTVKLGYLIELIEKNAGKKAKIRKMPDQPGDVPITCASIDKAKKLLGYEPKVKIEKGIEEFAKWYKAQ